MPVAFFRLRFATADLHFPSRSSRQPVPGEEGCCMWLPSKSSKFRLRQAENARRNRQEILKAWSQGQISRRELLKWGVFSMGGVLVAKSGLSPFVGAARADNIPTGLPSSPLFGVKDFSTPMPRFDVLKPVAALNPVPMEQANTTQQLLNTA